MEAANAPSVLIPMFVPEEIDTDVPDTQGLQENVLLQGQGLLVHPQIQWQAQILQGLIL